MDAAIQSGSFESQQVLYKVLAAIQADWGFNNVTMARLIHIRANTYGYWLKNQKIPIGAPPFSADMEAVIVLIAIHRSLSAIFNRPADQVIWFKSPHPDFKGQSPLESAIDSVQGLFFLRAYLDYVRGRGA